MVAHGCFLLFLWSTLLTCPSIIGTAIGRVALPTVVLSHNETDTHRPAHDVFREGKFEVAHKYVNVGKLPLRALVVSPVVDKGTFPVVLFLHGYGLHSINYLKLLEHIASHGFILVAPQLHSPMFWDPFSERDYNESAAVADWLCGGNLHDFPGGGDVRPDLSRIALAGHSRGGQRAFALALHPDKSTLRPDLLIGIDPVAGPDGNSQIPPKVLHRDGQPHFELGGKPVLVIGTGLGSKGRQYCPFPPFPPCAPKEVSHNEFYAECEPPCYHIVVSEYGHMEVLDDGVPGAMCSYNEQPGASRDLMRRTTGGVVVAFLDKYFGHGPEAEALDAVLADPEDIAPAKLGPVDHREVVVEAVEKAAAMAM